MVKPGARPWPRLGVTIFLVALLYPIPMSGVGVSSQNDESWNSAAAVELMRRAVDARSMASRSSDLSQITARADGYIYFFVDREDGGQPVPLRVDQFSLDLHWAPPNRIRQAVRGYRKEELLPVQDFDYYPDRLTVIHNGYGNEIQVGEGRDVRNVPHPFRVDGSSFYEYRLGERLSIRLPGDGGEIGVRELEVRPLDSSVPGILGTLYVEEETGSLVRMSFTFTPSSYVDRRNDRVKVTLEHSLWDGRYWLPYRQTIEVRREIPEIDLPFGSVIRGELEVSGYDFDSELDQALFSTSNSLVWAADSSDQSERFETGLFDGMADQGLSPRGIDDVMATARSIAQERVGSGLPVLRPYVPSASGFYRANRTEGSFLGLGLSYTPHDAFAARAYAGHGSRSDRTTLALDARWGGIVEAGTVFGARAFSYEARDLGQQSGASGLTNTFATLLGGNDYRDVYFASGGELWLEHSIADQMALRFELKGERHEADVQSWFESPLAGGDLRGVREINVGNRFSGRMILRQTRSGAAGWEHWGQGSAEGGAWRGEAFGTLRGTVNLGWQSPNLRDWATFTVRAGTTLGETPVQHLFLLGGRHTVPGFAYRSFAGRSFVLTSWTGSTEVWPRKLALRALASAGWTAGDIEDQESADALDSWPVRFGSGPRASIGVGVGLLREIFRLDYSVGIGGGSEGEFVFSINPSFWAFL